MYRIYGLYIDIYIAEHTYLQFSDRHAVFCVPQVTLMFVVNKFDKNIVGIYFNVPVGKF